MLSLSKDLLTGKQWKMQGNVLGGGKSLKTEIKVVIYMYLGFSWNPQKHVCFATRVASQCRWENMLY